MSLTPVIATAQETKKTATGFYTTNSFTSPLQYKMLSLDNKRLLIAKKDLVFLVGNEVYFAKDALGKSDAQLEKFAKTVSEFEKEYGQLTNSGYDAVNKEFEVTDIN